MYELTLTSGERQAIDWVGYRYATGDDFRDLLYEASWEVQGVSVEDIEWDCPNDITFAIPENVAWEAANLFAQDNYTFPCFAEPLAFKLARWADQIV